MCLKSRKSYFSFYSMIHLSKWDPWHTLKFIAFPQSGRDVGVMINRWGVLIILISSLCSLWKWVAEGTNEQAILKDIKIWFQVSPFFYFHILISNVLLVLLSLYVSAMALVPLWYCPSTSGYCSCVALRHPLKKVILPCPSRAELETRKTGFVICCQICFYGSKFFCIGLLTTNASLSRASCKSFCSGFVPCVNPASLSPSSRVLYCIPLYFWGLGEFHKWCAYGIDFPVLFQWCRFLLLAIWQQGRPSIREHASHWRWQLSPSKAVQGCCAPLYHLTRHATGEELDRSDFRR